MDVRPAERRDLDAIRDIYNHAVLTSTATYDDQPRTTEQQQAWFDEHQSAGLPVLVAEDGGQVLGWSSLSPYRPRPAYRFTVEDSVYVREGHQRQGIGGALLRPLIDAARAQGLHSVVAVIDSASEPSLRLHLRHGFTQTGHLRQVGWKFDRWLDTIELQLVLD